MRRSRWVLSVASVVLVGGLAHVQAPGAVKLKIQGSTTVNPVVAEAGELMHAERGWEVFVDTQGGSSGGISALGDGLVDIGMISKPVSVEDRAKYPTVDFQAHTIGLDGVALVVSRPVWDGGVHALTKEQIQGLYEGRIANWKDVGGPDAPVVFYNKEPGRGTWEVFADWAYGGHQHAPTVNHPEVGGNEEGRNKVAAHPSAITQLSFAWAEGSEQIKALGIQLPGGAVIFPTREAIRNGTYPLIRQLAVVTNGPPTGPIKEFIELLLSERGQQLVQKHGYLPVH